MRLLAASIVTVFSAQPAYAGQPVADAPWTLALSGGINGFDHDKARAFGSLSLDRDLGNLSLGIAASVVDSRQEGIVGGNLPSTTHQLSLSAGYAFGALTVDGYGAVGWRRFATERFSRPSGAGASLSSHGRSVGAGATLTYDLPVGATTFLSPFASLDYSRVDIARIATVPAGTFVRRQREKGFTGGIGMTLAHAFGGRARHNFALYVAAFATSNDAASTAGTGPNAGSQRFLEGAGIRDRWMEAGPSASFAFSETFHLDLAAARTFGLRSSDGTTVSAALRKSF